jgi:tetratricopeptide (TPR) repeat protein
LQRLSGVVDYSLGDVLQDLSRSGEALDAYRASLQRFRRLQERETTEASAESRRALTASLHKLGEALLRAGEIDAAEANFREMSVVSKGLLAESPDSAAAQRDFTVSLLKIGDALVKRRDGAGALPLFEQALEMGRRKFVADPQSAQALRDVAVTLLRIGEALTCQAEQERDPRRRKALWQRARASYVEGEALHLQMKERGQWMVPDGPMLARYRAGMEKCEAALRSRPSRLP